MSIDEGVIKYESDWRPGPAPDPTLTQALERWRQPLFERGLIGEYEDLGIGYGNLSVRAVTAGHFVISGTQTGHLAETTGEHYALVTDYDIDANRLSSTGPVEASSEALTHAALYDLDAGIGAVVHVHDDALWHSLMKRVPVTAADVAYGTPAMAREFRRLYEHCDFATCGVAVMGGHAEGIVAIGTTLGEAATRILELDADTG